MTFSWLRLALFATAVVACGKAPQPRTPSGRSLVLSEDAPPRGYLELREVSVKSGKGCGLLGQMGSREGAETMLRDAAADLGASYVQVTSVEAPRPNHQCIEHEYKMTGVAYRDPAAPVATPPVAAEPVATTSAQVPAPAPPPPPAPPVCVPGATQACLGPGACSGAQACRDDASGFQPCDCGKTP